MRKLAPIWLAATLVAGTLDLLSAFGFAGLKGVGPMPILEYVASGPFGDRALHDPRFAIVGVLVHFAIMACMAAVYLFAARRVPVLTSKPVLSGVAYGFGLWILMYWIVRPMRWPNVPLPIAAGPIAIAQQLFSHLILVGIPIALIVARGLLRRR